ncbi:MAG: magnesium chelatase, partial [Clostridia bacterium]|nr:magnesium chelatase [Clostridia bacterium]
LHCDEASETSAQIRERVINAREFATRRFKDKNEFVPNASLSSSEMRKHCVMTSEAEQTLEKAYKVLSLSARGHDRLLKVARTIADIHESEKIERAHIAQAMHLRSLDRKYWS